MESSTSEVKGFNTTHLTDQLFSDILHGFESEATLIHWGPNKLNTSNSVLAALTAADTKEIKRFVGHMGYCIQYKMPGDEKDKLHSKDVVLKAKPPGVEIENMLNNIAKQIGGKLGEEYEKYKYDLDLSNTDHKEVEIMRINEQSFQSIFPCVFYTKKDEIREIFVYGMENFISEGYTHMDTVEDISMWKEEDILDVLKGVAGMHARFYGRVSEIPLEISKWLKSHNLLDVLPVYKELFKYNTQSFKDVWDPIATSICKLALDNVSTVSAAFEASPKSLVHNDCNVRNICFRPSPVNGKNRLCLYDWELISIAPPQHDVAEFLCFVLPPNTSTEVWQSYVTSYLKYLTEEIISIHGAVPQDLEASLEPKQFLKVFGFAVLELLINRLAVYGVSHTVNHYPFLARVVQNGTNYMHSVTNDFPFLKPTE